AEVGEDEPAGRPHHHLTELHDANPCERADVVVSSDGALLRHAHAALRSAFGIPASCKWPVRCLAGMCELRISRVAISRSRSMPVERPISSSMKTRSSVTMLPRAPGAKGHPPRPDTAASKR